MKRKSDDSLEPGFNNVKPIKSEKDGNADYSQDVKKKINASARTGQACDRCRVRKMRCDDQPNGCGPCMQNQSECKTTDRISGKATVRGYVQSLERRLEELGTYTRGLQDRLTSLGECFKPADPYTDQPSSSLQWQEPEMAGGRQVWEDHEQVQDVVGGSFRSRKTLADGSSFSTSSDESQRLPEFRPGLEGNNYLGASTGNSFLSSIKGTSMNVLGMEIDLAGYMSPDLDEPVPFSPGAQPAYNKSYRAFLETAFGISPQLSKVELPPRGEGLNYAELYFRITNCYLPILHKPSFLAMISRMYDDPMFEPSIAETAMVHTMLAIVYYQLAIRASEGPEHQAEMNQSSNFHYHYALGFFGQLLASHTLADVQALTMLCLHIRNFPKPGPCWMITSITLDLAIELGLHRSAKRWAQTVTRNPLEVEIRKRVFWSLLVIHIIIAGNLGRPMALRLDDFDVEVPGAIDDDLLGANGLDTSRPGTCRFIVGLEAIKVMPLFMELYNNIYAVKRSARAYTENVLRLEKRIDEWSKQRPAELKDESAAGNELGRVHAQYMAIWPLHMRLLLRHPSLSLTTSPGFNKENLSICMDVSKQMLYHVKELQKYKSLDGTWQTGALYVLAISTTLFGHWERKDSVTASDLATLGVDMGSWLSVIGDMSILLGSGRRLQEAVRVPIDRTLGLLAQHLASKSAAFAAASNQQHAHLNPAHPSAPSVSQPTSDTYQQVNNHSSFSTPDRSSQVQHQGTGQPNVYLREPINNAPSPAPAHAPQPSLAYENTRQYPYPSSYTTNPSTYSPQFQTANALPATAAAANAYMTDYSATTSQNYDSAYNGYHAPGSPTSWRTWTGNMASSFEPGAEYMNSASALMQLGGRSEANGGQDLQTGASMEQVASIPRTTGGAQMWPYLSFGNPNSDGR